MPTTFTNPSNRHPIIDDDQLFFKKNRHRKLRIRPYVRGEFGWEDETIAVFAQDYEGNGGKVNIIVVYQLYSGYRKRLAFYCGGHLVIPDSDKAIASFLASYGYGPDLELLKCGKGEK